jgi:hypothetical protein
MRWLDDRRVVPDLIELRSRLGHSIRLPIVWGAELAIADGVERLSGRACLHSRIVAAARD